jgi:glycine cleavage system H protein
MNCPAHLKYTKDHEWILVEGNTATVGITDFAQDALGDIIYVDISTIGKALSAEATFGAVDAVKTASDLFIPVAGTITEKNAQIEADPSLVNTDPYGAGWMVKMTIDNIAEIDGLMSADQYAAFVG